MPLDEYNEEVDNAIESGNWSKALEILATLTGLNRLNFGGKKEKKATNRKKEFKRQGPFGYRNYDHDAGGEKEDWGR